MSGGSSNSPASWIHPPIPHLCCAIAALKRAVNSMPVSGVPGTQLGRTTGAKTHLASLHGTRWPLVAYEMPEVAI